jgi:hypothetical protein
MNELMSLPYGDGVCSRMKQEVPAERQVTGLEATGRGVGDT